MVIAVFGSGDRGDPHARATGKAIGELGHDLLTGGGGGCMQSALEGFQEAVRRTGESYAILPRNKYQPAGYDHVFRTCFDAPKDFGASPYSRNLVNVAFCHACVFVSDSPGTLTEIIWMHRVGKPSAFFGTRSTWQSAQNRLSQACACHDIVTSITEGEFEDAALALVNELCRIVVRRISQVNMEGPHLPI